MIFFCLGNPGREYTRTRHNIGFMAADFLIKKYNSSFLEKFNSLYAKINTGKNIYYVVKPQTYMNNSGDAVNNFKNFFHTENQQLCVVADDCNIPFGALRIRCSGSAGGHNGLKSVIARIGDDFPRVRCGIGSPENKIPLEKYVLSAFDQQENAVLPEFIEH
ncbi:MAG: aminoacyl-tRNA hydrolase, partial [Spirochaetes bacterium GWF1_41_5]